MDKNDLIARCQKKDSQAQEQLYAQYNCQMLGLCKRYVKDHHSAEDAMLIGFLNFFSKIDQLKNPEKFEAWLKKIMVNACLVLLRQQKKHANVFLVTLQDANSANYFEKTVANNENLHATDILNLLNQLPTGYRTVFNLFVIEGYKHKDIAQMLGISINTSKSQLINARIALQALMLEVA